MTKRTRPVQAPGMEQTTGHAPGWFPVSDQVNTMQYFDGTKGVEGTIPAPGLDVLERIAADVRVIKAVALLWATLALIAVIAVTLVLARD